MLKVSDDDKEVLQSLEMLSGSKARGQKLEPAWFHPFPARMPVSISEHLIGRLTTPDAVILDPMVGSGTTLIAARRLGCKGIGFDRDPIALLIARTSIRSFELKRLAELKTNLLEFAKTEVRSGRIRVSKVLGNLPVEDREFIQYWFPMESQEQLLALAQVIEDKAEGAERELAWAVFSSLIIAKSAGASFALDISRSRPHRRLDKPIVLPFDGWSRRFNSTIERLPFVDDNLPVEGHVEQADARSLPLKCNKVDLVLTSPPYLTGIDYLRAHKFSLIWMGYRLNALRDLRGSIVGTRRGLYSRDSVPPTLEQQLNNVNVTNRKRAQVRQYLSDLFKVLKETHRVLRPGGLAILIVGPSIIRSWRTDATEVVSELSERVGLRVIGDVVRKLSDNRRSLPPPAAAKGTPLARRMRREVIVALRK